MKALLEFSESETSYRLAFLSNQPYFWLRPLEEAAAALIDETEYLLCDPLNAKQLLEALERFRRGEYELHNLIEPSGRFNYTHSGFESPR